MKGIIVSVLCAAAAFSQGARRPNSASAHSTQPGHASSQPFALKGDILGETIEEFRARNARVITLGQMGLDRAKLDSDLPKTKNLPQCSSDGDPDTLSWDVRYLTDQEKRSGVVKCIAALSLDDDWDFEDSPTITDVEAYKTVYYFFHRQLYMIVSTLPGSQYPTLRNAFVEKYGVPSITNAQFQNSFGAQLSGERLLWKNGVSQILMGQRDGGRDDLAAAEGKDSDVRIRSMSIETKAIGKRYELKKIARVYAGVLEIQREHDKQALQSDNVLITISLNDLRKECEAAAADKGRQKDM
jgi:hypothetical protein